ncbi:MAG: nucleotidyltransferase domain-containing protein [bacterium]
MQPPTALAHLRKLQDQGKLQRIQTSEGPRYAVLPYVSCEWTDPDHGIQTAWQSTHSVDWRFPLVSRVPDASAQDFLYEWLDRAQARGLLPPARSRFEAQSPKPHLLQAVVYGSCARGPAPSKSDVDILLYGDIPKTQVEKLKDLGHEIALKGGRPPDIRSIDAAGWSKATPAFRESIQREGRTVYSNEFGGLFLERPLGAQHA